MTHTHRRAQHQSEPLTLMIDGVGSIPMRLVWRLLREKYGRFRFLNFEESAWRATSTLRWNGVLHSGEPMNGALAVKAIIHGGNLVVGAEITASPTSRTAGALITTRVEKVDVTYSDGGLVTVQDVQRLIEPLVGPTSNLSFRKSKTDLRNTVFWSALDQDGDLIWGALVLHAAVSDSQVVSWAEIEIDRPIGPDFRKQGSSDRDTQLETIARMGRDLIRKLHTKPRIATPELLGALVAIVEEAESEVPKRTAARVADRFVRQAPGPSR